MDKSLLAATLVATLLSLSCACVEESDRIQRSVSDLYSADGETRAAAASALTEAGEAAVAYLDPFESGCLDGLEVPPECENFDLALAATILVLEQIAASAPGSTHEAENPAKNLLWQMVHARAEDPFALTAPAWSRTDGTELRRRATAALDRLMAIPAEASEAEVSKRSIASATEAGRRWYAVESCAGGTMTSGCNHGLYLFDSQQNLVAFRLIDRGAEDYIGAGFMVGLAFAPDADNLAIVRSTGGFGGDLERLTFYRIDDDLTPLCSLTASDTRQGLEKSYDRYLSFESGRCQALGQPGDEISIRQLSAAPGR